MKETKNSHYLIAVDGGEKYYLIGNNMIYTEYFKNALRFSDVLSALLYIEKHGLERLARIICYPPEID